MTCPTSPRWERQDPWSSFRSGACTPPLLCFQSSPSLLLQLTLRQNPLPVPLLPKIKQKMQAFEYSHTGVDRTAATLQFWGSRSSRGGVQPGVCRRARGDAGPGGQPQCPAPAGRPRPRRARLAGVKSRLRRRKAAGEGRPDRVLTSSPLCRARNVGTVP